MKLLIHSQTSTAAPWKVVIIFKFIALRWMPRNHNDQKSTLVHVMTWCHQATSHYLSHSCCHMVSLGQNELTKNLFIQTRTWVNREFYRSLLTHANEFLSEQGRSGLVGAWFDQESGEAIWCSVTGKINTPCKFMLDLQDIFDYLKPTY